MLGASPALSARTTDSRSAPDPDQAPDAPITAILLACGRGTRFDPSGRTNKLMAPLSNGAPLATEAARRLRLAVPRVIAVVRDRTSELALALRSEGCDTVVCEQADRGMGQVISTGIRSAGKASGWIIALADMPQVDPATIDKIRRALIGGASIAAPYHQGRRGNPVGFGLCCTDALLALDGEHGARHLLAQRAPELTQVHVDDPGILVDVDTPEALNEVCAKPNYVS